MQPKILLQNGVQMAEAVIQPGCHDVISTLWNAKYPVGAVGTDWGHKGITPTAIEPDAQRRGTIPAEYPCSPSPPRAG